MTFETFAKYLEDKDFEKLVHEVKTDSNQRILGQGVAEIALFMSELMMQAIMETHKLPTFLKKEATGDLH